MENVSATLQRKPAAWRRRRRAQIRMSAVSALAALAALLPVFTAESFATAVGTLSNFDVVNDTPGPCHGFEIELEDIHPNDVPYTFGGSYIRYGTPEVLDTTVDPAHPRVLVRYRHFNGSEWESTPVAPANITPGGHDCYLNGPIGNYASSGCEHYGVSLNASPTTTTYRWLVAVDPADPNTTFNVVPQTVNIPVPVWNVVPPAPGGGNAIAVRAEVEPVEEENPVQYGEPQWMKVFKVESEADLQPEDLNKLLLGVDGGLVPGEAEVETEWKLIQSKPGNAEDENEDADVREDQLHGNNRSVIRRYEFYRYSGPRDPENNEALPCIADDTPVPDDAPVENCSDLSEFVGAQNVAIDAGLTAVDAELPPGEVGVELAATAVALGGVPPFAISVTANALPDGLQADDATGTLMGIPTKAGTFSFSLHIEDDNGDSVDEDLSMTIVPPVEIDTVSLPQAVVGECYSASVSASGGLGPYTWSDISMSLPAWSTTFDNSDISGCPDVGDTGTSPIAFIVTDSLGGTSSKTLDLEVAGLALTPAGDCNVDGETDITELQECINAFLVGMPLNCPLCNTNSDDEVDIVDLQGTINCFLNPLSETCPLLPVP